MDHINLNLRTRNRKTSSTIFINERSKELQQQGRTIYRFGLGQSPFPVPSCVVKELQHKACEKDYLSPQGFILLREAVSRFYSEQHGMNFSSDHIMIGPGSKELMFIAQLAFYGDLVVTSPCWVSYVPQAEIIGRKICVLDTSFDNKWRATAQSLRSLCESDPGRPRLFILNYPGNPEGQTYSESELRELADVAREFGVIVLSDEIYSLLTFDGSYTSIANYYPEGTIVSSGLSKWCGAGGWRLGTFCFPPQLKPLLESMVSVASETFTSVSAPIQHAAIRAFDINDEIQNYLLHSRKVLQKISSYCCQELSKASVRLWEPEGGFYILLDLSPLRSKLAQRQLHSAAAICEELLNDTGVAVLPGTDFLRDNHELSIRLAFVDFDGEKALQISQEGDLEDSFLKEYCPKIVDGITAIVNWLG